MNPTPAERPPTADELAALSALCSPLEWERNLCVSVAFLHAARHSLDETERVASALLGRKISVSKPSLKNAGDETL